MVLRDRFWADRSSRTGPRKMPRHQILPVIFDSIRRVVRRSECLGAGQLALSRNHLDLKVPGRASGGEACPALTAELQSHAHGRILMIKLLANLKLRRKLLLAMAPLALMVIVAGVYSSFESKTIDTWYSNLIDTDVKGLRSLTEARSHTNRYGMFLYLLVAETDPDRKQVIDGEMEKTRSDYEAVSSAALREIPERADKIKAAAALFDKTVADARPVRAAALAGNNEKALSLLHAGVSEELQQARQAAIAIVEELQTAIDQRSDELTRNTHHAILITWLVIGFGLVASLAAAVYIVQTEVVQELVSLQGSIRDLANGKLDQPILY